MIRYFQQTLEFYLQNERQSQTIRLSLNIVISVICSWSLYKIMPKFKEMFMRADLKGIDLSKKEKYAM